MEKFEAKIFRPELIVLANSNELTKLYGLIEKDENFIISWTDEELHEKHSEVIVATHIIGKVKNGEMKLHSIENESKIIQNKNIGGK